MSETLQEATKIGHLRILASAGSGKTYQLSNRYLRIVYATRTVETILASTFTRLAAGEIRGRILSRLADAVDRDTDRASLGVVLGAHQPDRASMLELLVFLAKRVHSMNIRTLDSFFASIVQGFPFELQLPPGASVVDDDEASVLRDEAIRRMLDAQDVDRTIEILRRLTREEAARSVYNAIVSSVVELSDLALEADDDAWDVFPLFSGRLDADVLEQAIDAFCALEVTHHGLVTRDHATACEVVRVRDWMTFLSKGLGKAIACGDELYRKKAIPDNVRETYEPLVGHACAIVLNGLRDRQLATRDLLRAFHAHYEAVKRQRGVVTFRDLTSSLDRAERLGTLDEICFRIDQRLEHVLFDEFQDTSIPQWRALEPNLRELVSDATTGRSFFCVGDLKQAIYEWRNASPDVLDRVPVLLFGEAGNRLIEEERLPVSWRSSPVVIQAVNDVFEHLSSNRVLDDAPKARDDWASTFDVHEVANVNKSLPGYVELRTLDAPEEEEDAKDDQKERERAGTATDPYSVRIHDVVERVAQLHAQSPSCSIGILTRRVKTANRILFELHLRDLHASGAGGGPLTDAPAVNAILDLLDLAIMPHNTVAAFNVATSPLGPVVELDAFSNGYQRQRVARRVRRRVQERGLGPFIADLVNRLAPACDEREVRRLVRLVEMAESFDARRASDLGDFVKLVEQRAVNDYQPAPIQVMTIHKSKGLEFDAVFLPELDWKMIGVGHPKLVYERDGVVGPVRRLCVAVNEDLRNILAYQGVDIQSMYDDERYRRVRESLCLLYVALTRARQGLYMTLDAPVYTKSGALQKKWLHTAGGLLWSALAEGDGNPTAGAIQRSYGDAHWFGDASGSDASTPSESDALEARSADTPPRIEMRAPETPQRHALAAASPSSARALSERLRLTDVEATDRGTAFHACFECIEWIDTFDMDDAGLDQLLRDMLPRRDEGWRGVIIDSFRAMLERPTICSLLTRPPTPGTMRVLRECPYDRLTDVGIQSGVIDRLVITFDDGVPVGAQIIDFKTDQVAAEQCITRASNYDAQLDSYIDAIAVMYGLDREVVEAGLLFLECDQFVVRGG